MYKLAWGSHIFILGFARHSVEKRVLLSIVELSIKVTHSRARSREVKDRALNRITIQLPQTKPFPGHTKTKKKKIVFTTPPNATGSTVETEQSEVARTAILVRSA